ncbi:hypothetical protein FHR83_006763 [Actinoplanes campanulatus]|uniref:Uncharacterized protein n=1 Tax=Actinoplanes campanulatus TaxID=113559 RepID=A0A7W5FI20_9ACTN|nr:hypothetical protein [Actinoplanes campanulatus]MBB3099057.1 hypothetical protein [Actinoplanes campanulatus]GGN39231.1 hypothetical protein GCM10010109_66940 [Actinoplanes campanulatus]GID40215.1 hypothetical protein Aca09nite_67210 [Actinoplanes campanulatus]
MTVTTAPALTFADIPGQRAWYRVDDVFDPATRIHIDVPYLHHDLDCRWPVYDDYRVVTRGGASIVEQEPFFDGCDSWGDSSCPDAPFGHRRPVPVCPACAPALTGRSL